MNRTNSKLRERNEYLSVFKLILTIDDYLKDFRQCVKVTHYPLLDILRQTIQSIHTKRTQRLLGITEIWRIYGLSDSNFMMKTSKAAF